MIEIKQYPDGSTLMRARGRITMGERSHGIRLAVQELIRLGYKRVVIDLSSVQYMDSAGIEELLKGIQCIEQSGGTWELVHFATRVKMIDYIQKQYSAVHAGREAAAAVACCR